MQDRLLFVIGSPRSGSTMLMRMLAAHSQIYAGPEPHLLTPLAHLGYYDNVDAAPFDHLNAAEALREFVSRLPDGEEDYLKACRAYTDHLYGQILEAEGEGARFFLDKTPAYALVLPFLAKLYPEARFVVLTRHPAAIFCSYAHSFFDGDFESAHRFNPIVERYVPAMARFIRSQAVPLVHVRYEELVADPEAGMEAICAFLGLDFEEGAINYGDHNFAQGRLNDPLGVQQHKRPSTASVAKWARQLAGSPDDCSRVRTMLESCLPEDLATWGYPVESLWQELDSAEPMPPSKKKWDRYRLERRILLLMRKNIHGSALGRLVERTRFYCDVLLR